MRYTSRGNLFRHFALVREIAFRDVGLFVVRGRATKDWVAVRMAIKATYVVQHPVMLVADQVFSRGKDVWQMRADLVDFEEVKILVFSL